MDKLSFVIRPEEAESAAKKLGITVLQLLPSLVKPAQALARPPISKFHVGAIGLGSSGRIYVGVNVEFPNLPLHHSIHAEQFLITNLTLNGERQLRYVAVSAAPCGHCRQFFQEIRDAPEIKILITDPNAFIGSDSNSVNGNGFLPLGSILPHRFGPDDLLEKGVPLILDSHDNRLKLSDLNLVVNGSIDSSSDLKRVALAAANRSYSPYSGCPSGVALVDCDGRVYRGWYMESAAYNPSLGPVQAALVDYIANGGGGGYELNPSKQSPNFKFVKGDIASADLVNYLLITEGIDTIMHFAAQTHVDNSFGNSFEFTKNNIYGTHVLLEACKVTGQIRRFIHVSTDEVYGETDEDAVVGNHEASQLLPTNPYSATKAGAEMLVMAYGRSYGLPVITTRGNNVYGPNQFPEKLIPKFILLAMQGKVLPIHGDGTNVRSYLYCEDVAEAFEVILHKGEVGHVYNIGTKKERRVNDVAKDICKLFNMDPEASIKFVENRPFNDQRYFLDDEKLKILGWAERTTWEEGLKKTMDWYTQNPDWWGDVSGALLPHPRMLIMPGARPVDGSEETSGAISVPETSSQSQMVVPTPRASDSPPLKFLIYGRTGWIGGLLGKLCEKQGIAFEYGKGRLEDRSSLLQDIVNIKPTHVFNAAGVTGRPNVDWCESHKTETIRANVAGTLTLADVCREHNLLMMNFATGCIFEYDEKHPLGSGIGYKEEDTPNFTGSFYSKAKAMVEELLKEFDNVCTLRVRMPISSDLNNPRNFITKISRYNKVVNIPNSMTVLDELLPISIEMAKRNLKGIWNFTNPGVVSHNEILEMYRDYIDSNFKWANFTLEEQAKVIVAPRSNNEMDASKLKTEFPELLSIKESLIKHVFEANKRT